jgi:hypothetical protein
MFDFRVQFGAREDREARHVESEEHDDYAAHRAVRRVVVGEARDQQLEITDTRIQSTVATIAPGVIQAQYCYRRCKGRAPERGAL